MYIETSIYDLRIICRQTIRNNGKSIRGKSLMLKLFVLLLLVLYKNNIRIEND